MTLYVLERADPRNLSVNITAASGRMFRWGPDESSSDNVPAGVNITTQMPGGFGAFSCSLKRRPDITYYDFDRFAPCTVTGAGGALTAFDGYLSSRPMDRGDSYSFTPSAIGWSGALKDDPSFSMVYIDRRLSKWGQMSLIRQQNIAALGNYSIGFFPTVVTVSQAGNPALTMVASGPFTRPISEAYYDAGANNTIARIQASDVNQLGYGSTDTNAGTFIGTTPDDSVSTDSGTTIYSGGDHGAVVTTPTAWRFGFIQHLYSYTGSAGAAGTNYGVEISNLAVIGNHGLPQYAGPTGSINSRDDGFYGGDIVADIVTRAAPLLSVTRGTTGAVVYTDNFVVPHLAFNTPVDGDTAIQQLNQYYLYDYGVYENKAFFWLPPGSGRQWHLRVGDGVKLSDQGPQIETAFNGVVVQYTDPAGAQRYVGPPGYNGDKDPVSGATSSSALQDTSSTNPVNQYGRKRWSLLQMGTTTWQGAVTVGSIFLQTAGQRPTSGTATVMGFARDSSGRDWPCWMIRAGDTVVFDDTNDQSARYVLNTSYAHDSLINTLTLDAPPNKLDWLLQRLGLSISAIG